MNKTAGYDMGTAITYMRGRGNHGTIRWNKLSTKSNKITITTELTVVFFIGTR